MNLMVDELRLDLSEFIHPDKKNGFPVDSGIKIIHNGKPELLIGYRYIEDQTYYFMFSQIEKNGERFIKLFPNKDNTRSSFSTVSYNNFLGHFKDWLYKVIEHKECTKTINNLNQKNKKSTNQKVDNYDRMVSFTNNPENSQILVLPLLYKYMKDVVHLKELLQSKELYLSNPRTFKDETDCRITFDSYDNMIDFCNSKLTVDAKQKIIESGLLNKNNSTEEQAILLYDHLMMELTNIVQILCLTECKDNLKFWEEYANNNNGYCVEFDFNKSEYNTKKRILPVDYSNEGTIRYDKNNFNIESTFLRKSLDYEVEKEFRLVYLNPYGKFLKSDIIINTDTIKSITFGYNYTGSIDEIKAIAKENGFNDIKYYQKKISFKGITIEEV